jgi:hypothetical protein
MMQIGNLQPQPQAFPTVPPADTDTQQRPIRRQPVEEEEPVFVSPPPAPWPRVFPGL